MRPIQRDLQAFMVNGDTGRPDRLVRLGPWYRTLAVFRRQRGSPGLHGAILDVKLGDQNCFAIADALRERGVPFAFATGGGGVGDDSGFENPRVLVKPFEFETVRAVVENLLERQ